MSIETSVYAVRLRQFYDRWRAQRRCEARARDIETVLREIDPRLCRDIGFELMAGKQNDPAAPSNHALIQAAKIAYAPERSEDE